MAVVFGSLGLEPKRLKDKRSFENGFVLFYSALNLLTFEVKWQLNHELAALFFLFKSSQKPVQWTHRAKAVVLDVRRIHAIEQLAK